MRGGAPPYSIAANLRWFAGAYLTLMFFVGAAHTVLQTFGIILPAIGVAFVVFAGAAAGASNRFAERRPADGSAVRRALTIGYVGMAFAVSVVAATLWVALVAAMYPNSPVVETALAALKELGWVYTAQLTAFAIGMYVIAWLLLGYARARVKNKGGPQHDA